MPGPDPATSPAPPPTGGDRLYADDRFVVHAPAEVRALLQALVDQRATLSVHPDGGGQSVPGAVLEVDEDTVLLDGSPLDKVNRRIGEAAYLLCYAQVDQVQLRFRVEGHRREERDGYVSFRAPWPRELFHMQRRELYRVATSLDDAPWCLLPDPAGGKDPLRLRVVDISAGGVALLLPEDQTVFELERKYSGCVLELPDGGAIPLGLRVRSLVPQRRADGSVQLRVGLRFEDLPRGADGAIQRHIFNIDRRRNARMSGLG